MLKHNFRPLAVCFGLAEEQSFIFNTSIGTVRITGCNDILPELLSRCNGFRTIEEVLEPFTQDYDLESLEKLVEKLVESYIICDSRHLYRLTHITSSNPMSYYYRLGRDQTVDIFFMRERKELDVEYSPLPKPNGRLVELLDRRHSSRDFQAHPNLGIEEFSTIVWCITGRVSRDLQDTIAIGPAFNFPSGGRIYSIEQYFILLGSLPDLETGGIYHYDKITHRIGLVRTLDPKDSGLSYSMNIYEARLENVFSVHVLTSRFWRSAQKYGNRGHRYAILEAGHCAQNAYLCAAELGFSILEYGGFYDEALARILGIDFPEETPLITLLIGKEVESEPGPVRITS